MNNENIKIGIVGHKGRMGQEILKILSSKSNIDIIIENGEIGENKIDLFKKSNIVIDFTNENGLKECLECAKLTKKPLVSGSTPINNDIMEQIQDSSKYTKICWSANMSIGIAVVNKLSSVCAKILKNYDCEILEKHHNKKKDAPSGTAIMIGKTIAKERNLDFDKIISLDRNAVRKNNQIGFASIRGGNIAGEHEIMFIGDNDEIIISHKAYNRTLFAIGAIECAMKLLQQKTNGFYRVEDLLF